MEIVKCPACDTYVQAETMTREEECPECGEEFDEIEVIFDGE